MTMIMLEFKSTFTFFVPDHCMVNFVKPNYLGTPKEFNNRFVNPINNGQCTDSSSADVTLMKRRSHVLHRMLEGFVQVRYFQVLICILSKPDNSI